MSVIPLPKCDEPEEFDGFFVDGGMFDTMMPLHVVVDPAGKIRRVGPTFKKLMAGSEVVGESLFDFVQIKRPAGVDTVATILAHEGESLSVFLKPLSGHKMKSVAARLPSGGLILNFSLGATVLDIVQKTGLKTRDFSPADPTVEMIYMIEVQKFVYQQHKQQSHRLQGARVHAEEQAFTDALTGLANRRALENHLARLLRRSKGNGFALMQIDLDFFKAVNDTHGHAAGDFVLQQTSRILVNQMRATDLVARIGGDEFVVVLSEFGDRSTVASIGQRIIERVGEPIDFEGALCQIGASIGATIVDQGSQRTPDEILADADRALYVSKEQGRGMYHLDVEIGVRDATIPPH